MNLQSAQAANLLQKPSDEECARQHAVDIAFSAARFGHHLQFQLISPIDF